MSSKSTKSNNGNEQRVERVVFVLNDFDQQNYPFKEMKTAIALGKKVYLVYTTPYFPPVFGIVSEFFRIFANIQSEAKMTLNLVNLVLDLPRSHLHILSQGATRSFRKCVERSNKGNLLTLLRSKAGSMTSVALSKLSLMRFA